MKLEDLDTIRETADARSRAAAVLARMQKTSPRLVLGIGTDAIDIIMPPTLQKLVADSVTESLTDQIAAADDRLRELGVEVGPAEGGKADRPSEPMRGPVRSEGAADSARTE
jgi:hypothetical protein